VAHNFCLLTLAPMGWSWHWQRTDCLDGVEALDESISTQVFEMNRIGRQWKMGKVKLSNRRGRWLLWPVKGIDGSHICVIIILGFNDGRCG
jgi:hypothetical protein